MGRRVRAEPKEASQAFLDRAPPLQRGWLKNLLEMGRDPEEALREVTEFPDVRTRLGILGDDSDE